MRKITSISPIRIGIFGKDNGSRTGRGVGLWPSGLEGTLAAADAEPVFLDPSEGDESWEDFLAGLQGVVFSGWSRGDAPNPFVQEGLCHWCRDRHFPLLAIDAGLLVLNNALGGSNFLNLSRDVPQALQHRHRPEPGVRHALMVQPGTLLASLYGEGEIVVNSEHTQAVQRLAPGFLVSARALDGIVEAIEWQNSPWFCLGVQWQPASATASGLDIQLFRGLVDACRKSTSRSTRSQRRLAMGA